ncbi:MAG: histidine phosphatase family protein, partial [Sphingobium sp.]
MDAPILYRERHGQAAFHVQRRFQGRSDSAPTDMGRGHAMAVGRFLKDSLTGPRDAPIHASPFGRAAATGGISEQRSCPTVAVSHGIARTLLIANHAGPEEKEM